MRPLKLIFINDGCTDGFQWIALDGDEESLVPDAIIKAFPDLLGSAVCVRGYEHLSEVPLFIVRERIGPASVCLAESRFDTRLFTRDPNLHQQLLQQLKECLPDR